jgi:hypothetical protein
MMSLTPTRRAFCLTAASALAMTRSPLLAQSRSSTHPDVAAIDHDRILAAAAAAFTQPVTPITTLPATQTPGTPHDFYSEPEDFFPDPASPTGPWLQRKNRPANPAVFNPNAFTAHRDAVYALGKTVAALTAAFVITTEAKYAARAAEHLRAWFVTPATRMDPSLNFAQCVPNSPATLRFEGVVETVPLAEAARSVRFLTKSASLTPDDQKALHSWLAEYAQWLNDSRIGGLARDQKDHHGSSWLFQCAAFADANATGLTSDDSALDALRHRVRNVTLRAEINAFGFFPHCVSTPNPYRNSLFNLDLLAAACELLTTRFEDPWEYELQDGPGLRSAIAYHYPFILNRSQWPYPADIGHFEQLPARRSSLLLAGRAYSRPEYTALWKSLRPLPDSAAPDLLRTFPITQPLLWFNRAKP